MYNYYGNLDVVLKSFIENQTKDNVLMQIHVMIKFLLTIFVIL
jgi:hypothetical protein